MSRKTRRREFVLGEEEILQLLDFDDSDEEALLEIDEEDKIVLAEALAESASGDEPKIVDHDIPLEVYIRYTIYHIMKQYMKQKPIQRGFKHWCRDDSKTGYLFQFDIYVGKKTASLELGLSESDVMELTESLIGSRCRMFFDNFYTSPQLVYRLMKERKIYSCGTVKKRRRGLPKDMKPEKDLKKGEMDGRYYDGMSVVKWLNTKPVMMISTIDNGNPTNTVNVKRRKKGEDGKVDVKVPSMVQRYNRCIRGTNLLDQKTTVYAFDRKSPGKYYCRPFWDYIDMGLANSFIIYEKIASKFPTRSKNNIAKTQKDFRRMVAINLIGDLRQKRDHDVSESDYSDNEVDSSDPREYINVSANDSEPSKIQFSVGQKVVGPIIPCDCETPLQLFKLFFTDELVTKIVVETNKYANDRLENTTVSKFSMWKDWMEVTAEEMRAFLGVIINMGLLYLPDIKEYFSKEFTHKVPFFSAVFSRQRFLQIFWMLHLESYTHADPSLQTRTQKVSNFLTYLDARFREHFIPGQELSIDESVVAFKGRISFLTYNPKKPTKWGLRVYVLADSATSYVYSFCPYYGKITTDGLVEPELPFTTRIVLQLYQNLQKSIPEATGYHIFTNRFYTSPALSKHLLASKCHLTGTVMPNRKDVPQELKKPKLKRGDKLAYRQGNLLHLAWMDKRVVTMLSTWSTSASEAVHRRTKSNQVEVVHKPSVVVNYNKHMGGVDVADQYASTYCFLRKTLKWWRKFFFWNLEIAIINAYILHRTTEETGGNHLQI